MSSISTRTGDKGETSLLFGRRVSKSNLRISTNGAIDALNAHLGLARATQPDPEIQNTIYSIQQHLIPIMGEIAVLPEDRPRYAKSKLPKFESSMLDELDALVDQYESQDITFKGWALPGANLPSAALEVARTTCRSAEQHLAELITADPSLDPTLLQYFNRLSDVLWLMARLAEGDK